MNKQEFLAELRKGLCGLPQDDIEERLTFYSEMIDDRIEEGLSEEEAVSAIGDVEEIVRQTAADIPLAKIAKERIRPKRQLKAWEIVLLALGSPIWLSLGIAAAAVILALYISLWALIISLWAIFASLVIGAVVSIPEFGLLDINDFTSERRVEAYLCTVLLQLIAEVKHERCIFGLSRRCHSSKPLTADLIAGFKDGDLVPAFCCTIRRGKTGNTGARDKYSLRIFNYRQIINQLSAGVGIGDAVDRIADRSFTGAALIAADTVDYLIYLAGLCFVGQIRVGEGSTCHDDKVSFLIAQHGLGHIDVVVAADGEHRNADGLLDGGGVLGVVHHRNKTRRDYSFLGSEHTLCAMQSVNACLFKHFCHDYCLRKFNAALNIVASIEAEENRKVGAYSLTDSGDDFKCKPHTV